MNSRVAIRRSILQALHSLFFLLAFLPATAPAQTSAWDRAAYQILVSEPDETTGRVDVSLLWAAVAGTQSVGVDLSTEVVLQVNPGVPGAPAEQEFALIAVIRTDGPTGGCETNCGPGCGGLYVDGHINTMTCKLDGVAPGGLVDCDCGHWILSEFGGIDLDPGDLLQATLRPTAASLPEPLTSNDSARLVYDDHPVRYDRRVLEFEMQEREVPGAPAPLVFVDGVAALKASGIAAALDLSADLVLEVDGVVLQRIEAQARLLPDDYAFCEEIPCGTNCGGLYIDGHINTMTCRVDGVIPGVGVDCDCGYWWAFEFDPQPIQPGQLVVVRIEGSDGAVPELDDTNDSRQQVFQAGEERGWKRGVRHLALVPDPDATAGQEQLLGWIELQVENTEAVLDLSSIVVLYENGVEIDRLAFDAVVGDAPISCEVDCGPNCGGLYVDGHINTMTCRVDGVIPGVGVDCDCGYWIQVGFGGLQPDPGDVFELEVLPAPGAMPASRRIPSFLHSRMSLTHDGSARGWNRSLQELRIADGPAGTRQAQADLRVELTDNDRHHALGFIVLLLLDAQILEEIEVDLDVMPASGSSCLVDCEQGTCADFQSPDPHEWIVPTCGVFAELAQCGCGSLTSVVFEADLTGVDESRLTVRLIPLPGALPELPGFEDDDEAVFDPAVSAPTTTVRRARIESIHPNPFNPATTIDFTLSRAEPVTLRIYDVRGAQVKVLVDEERVAGRHGVTWYGTDVWRRPVSSGVYYVRLTAGADVITRKIVLTK